MVKLIGDTRGSGIGRRGQTDTRHRARCAVELQVNRRSRGHRCHVVILPVNLAALNRSAEHNLVGTPTVISAAGVGVERSTKLGHSEEGDVITRGFTERTANHTYVTHGGPEGVNGFADLGVI